MKTSSFVASDVWAAPKKPHPAQVLAITSGKGGVGKTFLCANLAAALSRQGLQVLVIDADLGLANLDVLLNLRPQITLHEVFHDRASVRDAIVPTQGGFDAMLAGSGLVEYSRLTPSLRDKFSDLLAILQFQYDCILLDTGAGISEVVLYTLSMADDVLVTLNPEPTSLADAYATIKVLALQQQRQQFMVAVNQVEHTGEGRQLCQQLQLVLDRFVRPMAVAGSEVTLHHLGDIALDSAVRDSIIQRQLLMRAYPSCAAAQSVQAMAGRLVAHWQTQAAALA